MAENFQRVQISGEAAAVSSEVADVCRDILRAGELRKKYVYKLPREYWGATTEGDYDSWKSMIAASPYGGGVDPPFRPFRKLDDPSLIQPALPLISRCESGVFHVYDDPHRGTNARLEPHHTVPSRVEFYRDLRFVLKLAHSPAAKSFSFQRLDLLSARFNLHSTLNSKLEMDHQKKISHRDFYNVRKVDTHIHHSACMNQKHLLRFIKSKLKHCGDEVVIKRNGKFLTLAQVFDSLNLKAHDLSIDMLDMHADNTFHRFDRFNLKYNPIGESRLREIFLKSSNIISGRYLAEITREVFNDCEESKYVLIEPRISIYGRSRDEWGKLARWYTTHRLASPNVRWMVQVPRLYAIYKKIGLVETFSDMLENIFAPLFEVSINPSVDPCLDCFLENLVAFDCVDDESKPNVPDTNLPPPNEWSGPENPPYSYWTYYLWANISQLNELRKSRGMTLFTYRPHAGEAGDLTNLASTFLCANGINHGILLRRAPLLQYLYYTEQIFIAVSPLSNNKLFLDYQSNPFQTFFKRGLHVSLSTDDPLMLHITREPLVEEYSCASQVWKLSATDMCEIARNSVLQSGFEHIFKAQFLGFEYANGSNDIQKTNVPDIRVQFRNETLTGERKYIQVCAHSHD